jgi:uncharacterized membrane protein
MTEATANTDLSKLEEAAPGSGLRVLPITTDQSGKWLEAGWRDFRRSFGVSITYGAFLTLFGLTLTLLAFQNEMPYLVLPLMSGFMLVGPVLAVGLYESSRLQEAGYPVTLTGTLKAFTRRRSPQLALMGFVLMLIFLAWIRVAMLLFALFYHSQMPTFENILYETLFSSDALGFLIVGSLIGSVFATAVFAVSVVGMPLLIDRRVDVITAVTVSINVVRLNWRVLIGWAATIVCVTGAGFVTGVGLAIALPVVGHASWHAYRSLLSVAEAKAEAIGMDGKTTPA